MPDFQQRLLSEIEFSKKYFDFIEITLELDLKKYSSKHITQIKTALGNFEILGHIHWGINLFNKRGLKKIEKSIKIFKKMGAKVITIHPHNGKEKDIEKLKQKNISQLIKINNFCKKNKIKLLIENRDKPPFNTVQAFNENFSNFKMTFDTGHAYKNSRKEFENFLKLKNKIKHIHLHDANKKSDHIIFNNKKKLKNLLEKIKKTGYNGTITLEIFRKVKSNKRLALEKDERRDLLIKQLGLIKELNKK